MDGLLLFAALKGKYITISNFQQEDLFLFLFHCLSLHWFGWSNQWRKKKVKVNNINSVSLKMNAETVVRRCDAVKWSYPRPTHSHLFTCWSLKVAICFLHTQKKATVEKTRPSGVMVNFQLTQRQKETKIQARFNKVHDETLMLSIQHTDHTNFHGAIPVICLKSHLHWDVNYQPWLQRSLSQCWPSG